MVFYGSFGFWQTHVKNPDGIYPALSEIALWWASRKKGGRQTGMSHETNVLQHLIRFVRGTAGDVVEREPGPAFKIAFDMVYGILKYFGAKVNLHRENRLRSA